MADIVSHRSLQRDYAVRGGTGDSKCSIDFPTKMCYFRNDGWKGDVELKKDLKKYVKFLALYSGIILVILGAFARSIAGFVILESFTVTRM